MNKFWRCLKNKIHKHNKQILVYTLIILTLFVLVSAYMNLVKLIIFALIIILINTFLRFYKRALPAVPIEFELTIFGTLLTGITYGLWPAMFVAVFSCLCADFLNQNIMSPFSLISLFTYISVSIISPFIPASNIFISGVTIVIIANLVIFFGNMALGYDHIKNFAYSATDIFFNYFLFKYLAEIVLKFLM